MTLRSIAFVTVRRFRQNVPVTFASVVMLGVGICATTTMFSVVDAVIMRPLPFPAPDRLVEISGTDGTRTGMPVPKPVFDALLEGSHDFQGISIHAPVRGTLKTADGAWAVVGDRVSANYFDVLGVRPLNGRGFGPNDDRESAEPAIVLSESMWRNQLGRPIDANSRIDIDGVVYSIVGVMPTGFRTSFSGSSVDFWTTRASSEMRALEASRGYEVLARLSGNVTIDAASQHSRALITGLGTDGWDTGKRSLAISTLRDEIVRGSGNGFRLLLIAAAAVLAVACANVAVLLLAQSERRVREFGLRRALGAQTAGLFAEAAFEGFAIAVVAGALGIAGSFGLLKAVKALAPSSIPRLGEAAIDARVLIFSVTMVALISVAVALLPAVRLCKQSVVDLLKQSATTGRRRQPTAYFLGIGLQIAISMTLAVFATLATQIFLKAYPFDLGFQPEHRYFFRLVIPPSVYPDRADRFRRVNELLADIQSSPGIRNATAASNIPFSGNTLPGKVSLASAGIGRTVEDVDFQWIFPRFFDLFGMQIVQGSALDLAPVGSALVDERLLGALGGTNVLGSTVRVGSKQMPVTIVGVVGTVRSANRRGKDLPTIYLQANPDRLDIVYLSIHADLASGLTETVRRSVRRSLPDVPLRSEEAFPMSGLVARTTAAQKLMAATMTSLAATALILSVGGVSAVVLYMIASRKRELAIRTALGATARNILWVVVARVFLTLGIAVVLSRIALSYIATFVQNQVGSIDMPTNALTASVFLIVTAITALAALGPARRAYARSVVSTLGSDRV